MYEYFRIFIIFPLVFYKIFVTRFRAVVYVELFVYIIYIFFIAFAPINDTPSFQWVSTQK